MKFKIHFTKAETEDFFIIEGASIDEVISKTKAECKKRGLKEKENNLYSEEIKN